MSIHLTFEDSTGEAIQRKDAALQLPGSAGWAAFLEGVEQRKLQLMTEVTYGKASPEGVDYERVLSQIRGLDQVEGILEGVIQYGRRAEQELRKLEESRNV